MHLVMHGCAQGPGESLHHPNTNAGRARVVGVPPLSRSRRPCRRRTPFACFHFCPVETMAENADELRAQLQAANARADAAEARVAELQAENELLRQVKALLEVFLANQRRRKLPISCGMECIAGGTW